MDIILTNNGINIPKTAMQIQEGLFLHTYIKLIGGKSVTFKQLYAMQGYRFYNHTLDDRDENGNLIINYIEDVAFLGQLDSEKNYTSEAIVYND